MTVTAKLTPNNYRKKSAETYSNVSMSKIFKEIKNRISKARTGHYVKKRQI